MSGDGIEEGEVVTTESGLQYEQIVKGDGPSPLPGDVVRVHYRGTLEGGTGFDSSYSRGQPAVLPIGEGRVIEGWEEGIPINATLIFEVELLEVR